MLFYPDFTHLRFNVNTQRACKKEKLCSCQKHTLTATPHMGLLHFLTRGKQEHYSWPGPYCFLTSSPRELLEIVHKFSLQKLPAKIEDRAGKEISDSDLTDVVHRENFQVSGYPNIPELCGI